MAIAIGPIVHIVWVGFAREFCNPTHVSVQSFCSAFCLFFVFFFTNMCISQICAFKAQGAKKPVWPVSSAAHNHSD